MHLRCYHVRPEEIGYARIRFQVTTMKNVNTIKCKLCFGGVSFLFLDANICVLASYCYFNYSLFAIYECKAVHKPCMLEFVYGKCLRFDTLPLICTKTGLTK